MNLMKRKKSILTERRICRVKSILSVYGRFFVRQIVGCFKMRGINNRPTTLQLPITYKCNFNCVMCGMRKLITQKGFSPNDLRNILSDPLFSEIRSVGVNGGEPFILPNLEDYIAVIVDTLPKVERLYIISNGFFCDETMKKSKSILNICHSKGIKYYLSISIDGYGSMQDRMRGKEGAFEHAVNTYDGINNDRAAYCDGLGAICTVTKINVDYLVELDTWAKLHGIQMSYNIATIHERIQNADKFQDFSVLTDEHARLMAEEFFYTKYLEAFSESYFSLYYYTHTQKRASICNHQKESVTLTPDGGLSYCATYSREIGNAMASSAAGLYFSTKNLKYRKALRREQCAHCSHYVSSVKPELFFSTYAKERLRCTRVFH